jgi:putative addiction module component (TIGR02574 family)
MTALAEQIYEKAVDLNPIDRAELIEKLFATFSPDLNTTIESKWKQEVLRRRLAYDQGEISSDTIENVFDRLAQR